MQLRILDSSKWTPVSHWLGNSEQALSISWTLSAPNPLQFSARLHRSCWTCSDAPFLPAHGFSDADSCAVVFHGIVLCTINGSYCRNSRNLSAWYMYTVMKCAYTCDVGVVMWRSVSGLLLVQYDVSSDSVWNKLRVSESYLHQLKSFIRWSFWRMLTQHVPMRGTPVFWYGVSSCVVANQQSSVNRRFS